MTANGDVTGENVDGIYAYNFFGGTNLTVTDGRSSVVDGNNFGSAPGTSAPVRCQ